MGVCLGDLEITVLTFRFCGSFLVIFGYAGALRASSQNQVGEADLGFGSGNADGCARHCIRLRLHRLHCHEPHGGALCRLDDRGRVVTVILLPLQEWALSD